MKKVFTLLLLTLTAFALKSNAQTNPCSAGFDFSVSGLSVTFTPAVTTNLSSNHHYWRFGDGAVSSDISPVHLYTSGGVYTVTHIFYRSENGSALCLDSVTKQVQLTTLVNECRLHAKFTFERDSTQSNKIKFTNLSTPTADIHYVKWSFGDGATSTDFNTSHVYTTSGLYNVCLTVVNSTSAPNPCYRDTCMQIQVQVPPPPCDFQPGFDSKADTINSAKIYFHSSGVPAGATATYNWFFGDNTTSTSANPDHVFAQPGIYNVCLKVSLSSTCFKYICKNVEVRMPLVTCNIQPYFSWRADSANNRKIFFTNQTILPGANVKVTWSFGDGTSSNLLNPDHTYEHGGTYNVCLTIYTSSICVRQFCKTIQVKEPELNCQDISKFSFTRSTVNCLEFKFVPGILNANWKYVWSFGDGTGSTDMSPSHVYQRSGKYTVFLTVFRSNSCVATSYKLVETGECFSCNNIWVKYEYTRSTTATGYIAFHAASNYPILTQTWTITKISISGSVPVILNQINPVYNFTESGDYRVCLRAVTQGQCIKEYCDVIHINSPVTYCVLESFPNPAHNTITLNIQESSPEMIHLYIYNSMNVLVAQKEQQGITGNNVVTMNVETLVPGIYTVRIVYGNHVCYSKFQKI